MFLENANGRPVFPVRAFFARRIFDPKKTCCGIFALKHMPAPKCYNGHARMMLELAFQYADMDSAIQGDVDERERRANDAREHAASRGGGSAATNDEDTPDYVTAEITEPGRPSRSALMAALKETNDNLAASGFFNFSGEPTRKFKVAGRVRLVGFSGEHAKLNGAEEDVMMYMQGDSLLSVKRSDGSSVRVFFYFI
jgi:hypothetical protein